MKNALVVFAGCAVIGSIAGIAPALRGGAMSIAQAQDKPAHKAAPPAAAPAAEPAAAAPETPKPAPEIDAAFKFLVGNWKCDTKFPAGSMGPGSPEMTGKSTIKFTKAYGGFYYQGEYAMKKTKTMPGFKGTLFLGYQPGAKVYTIALVDDMGGIELAISSGFRNDTIIFTGEGYVMGQKVKLRETITKKSEKEVSHKVEAEVGKTFQSMGEDTCTR